MSAHAEAFAGRPALSIRGTPYPVLLPTLRDPRLHLASVIVSLQVLGQVGLGFRLSIAQILIAILTCAVLESGIAFFRQRVIMWPASALLTGNGVAFVLRVPGTPHGDWWSTRGWWIFAGTAAVSILSKHVLRVGGRHVFNPSNIGLVLCFLVLGSGRAEPLDFWWGPMSAWMALALAIIVVGGLVILSRLRLLVIAVGFWLAFASGIALLAASGHEMTARWHLGPISGFYLWWVLVTSPEILVFLFFMITDPRTIPARRDARVAYALGIGLLATLLIAPLRTEYATKVAVLGALAIVCAARPLVTRLRVERRRLVLAGAIALAAYAAALFALGIPSRSSSATPVVGAKLPPITIAPSRGVSSRLDEATARAIAAAALRAKPGAERMRIWLEAGDQGGPVAVAAVTYSNASRTFVLRRSGSAWVLPAAANAPTLAAPDGIRLTDVAQKVGLDFRQDSFRYGMSNDVGAMMGGGLCWVDYNNDGWLDLFAVNSYSDDNIPQWQEHGGLPRSALFRNDHGRFTNVSRQSHADLQLRGNGCVAADFDGDGHTDLFVTGTAYDALLWNNGNGTFTEGARAAGIVSFGFHTGAAVADVNGDGRPDLYVAGYTDPNAPIPSSDRGFPSNYQGVRDELFLNEGHRHFREVGAQVGLDPPPYDHSTGAVFVDVSGDGRPDLYVANDEDPNRLYLNEPGGPLGFHFVDVARREHVADRNAGMGVAEADVNRDGRPDLFVTNTHGQSHVLFESRGSGFAETRVGRNLTGWGDSWIDLLNDGSPDLVVANGGIPVTSLAKDAGPIQVLRPDRRFVSLPLPSVNGRGVAAADYDNDGRVDVAVNSIGGRLVLLHNTSRAGHWLEVQLRRFAPGTEVTAVLPDGRRLAREVPAGSSYLSSEDPRVHFGLGAATSVRELIVGRTVIRNVRADRIVVVG